MKLIGIIIGGPLDGKSHEVEVQENQFAFHMPDDVGVYYNIFPFRCPDDKLRYYFVHESYQVERCQSKYVISDEELHLAKLSILEEAKNRLNEELDRFILQYKAIELPYARGVTETEQIEKLMRVVIISTLAALPTTANVITQP